MTPLVIDLSHHNVVPISFRKTKEAGIIGVIHKASEGATIKDDKVDAREYMARESRLMFGLYHFIRPSNVLVQTRNFLDVWHRYTNPDMLVALDYEDSAVSLDMCLEWLSIVERETGKKPVMYSGHVLKDKIGRREHPILNGTNYPLWLAQYNIRPDLPLGWKDYLLWQYTDKGEVAGVVPPTDLNTGEENRIKEFWIGTAKPPNREEEYRKALEDIRKRVEEALSG